MRFNFALSKKDNIQIAYDENTISYNLLKYGKYIKSDYVYDPSIEKINIITVGTGKDFTTLNEAVESITDSSITNRYQINVYPGIYETVGYYDLSTKDASFVGLVLPDYVDIIGKGNKKDIIIKGYLGTDASISGYTIVRNNVSTLNFYKNNNLKNVTVTSQNIRCSVHNDDYVTYAVESAIENIENCDFTVLAAEAGVTDAALMPFGAGAWNGRIEKFKDCTFTASVTHPSFIFHNNIASPLPNYFEFENCKFVGKLGDTIRVISAGSTMNDSVIFKGCKIPLASIAISNDAASGYVGANEWTIDGYGNYADTSNVNQFILS